MRRHAVHAVMHAVMRAASLAALIAGRPAACGGRDDATRSPQRVEVTRYADWSATITAMLHEARIAGRAPRVVCRTHGITEARCYRRRATRGAAQPVEVVADPALDLAMLKAMAERDP